MLRVFWYIWKRFLFPSSCIKLNGIFFFSDIYCVWEPAWTPEGKSHSILGTLLWKKQPWTFLTLGIVVHTLAPAACQLYSSDIPAVTMMPQWFPWVWALGVHGVMESQDRTERLAFSLSFPLIFRVMVCPYPSLSFGPNKSWHLSLFSVLLVRMWSSDFQVHYMRTWKLEVFSLCKISS